MSVDRPQAGLADTKRHEIFIGSDWELSEKRSCVAGGRTLKT